MKRHKRRDTYGTDEDPARRLERGLQKNLTRLQKKFYKGEMDAKTYKGISGGFGSYAQRGGNASMLRLRMSGGVMDLAKLKFIADAIETYHIKRVHLTTCQTLQFHDLDEATVKTLAVEALKCGIVTRGGGGDFPRNGRFLRCQALKKGNILMCFHGLWLQPII